MKKIQLKKKHIIFISTSLVLLLLGVSQINGTYLKSNTIEEEMADIGTDTTSGTETDTTSVTDTTSGTGTDTTSGTGTDTTTNNTGSGSVNGNCGNGVCDSNEDATNCNGDCGNTPYCGDNICNNNETPWTCSQDCSPVGFCGNSTCDADEDESSCPIDCMTTSCGDGTCNTDREDADSCPADCSKAPTCGDGKTDADEQCDDGNNDPGDGCYFCQNEGYCGNEKLDGQEECDPVAPNHGTPYCARIKENNAYVCSTFCECVLPQNKCGNKVVDEGETCDDGNTTKGDGCDDLCKLEPYCGDKNLDSGEECDPASTNNATPYCARIKEDDSYVCSTFCECTKPKVDCSKFTLTGADDIIEQETVTTTYQVRLKTEGEEKPKITSLSATSEPINTNHINAGGIDMDWKELSITGDGQSGIVKTENAKWYGTTGSALCYNSNEQSKYKVRVNANLDNGCELEKEFEMQVDFEPIGVNHGGALPLPAEWDLEDMVVYDFRFIPSLFGSKNYYKASMDLNGVKIELVPELHVDMKGQYRELAMREEKFHVQQFTGKLPWSDGGFLGVQDVIDEFFKNKKYVGYGKTTDEASENMMKKYFEDYNKIVDLAGEFTDTPTKCWTEKRAKENAGATKDVGGVFLECGYACDSNMTQPESPIEKMRRTLGM